MQVQSLDHVNIRTPDVPATSAFFAQVLGMTVKPTPMGMDIGQACWIYDNAGRAIIHVGSTEAFGHAEGRETKPEGAGRIHHVALRCSGHIQMEQRLTSLGISYRKNDITKYGMWQIFVEDPNGILLELNFGAE